MEYEDRITIPTPEGVSLELTLAGLGSRALAGAVDLVLKGVLVACMVVVAIALFGGAAALVVVPAAALTMLAYDVAFETLAGGRPPGKRLGGLRVVRSSGRPVDLWASMIRNVLRLVDGLPLSYVPTIVSILVTRRNQRLGDLAADTVVIRDARAAEHEHRATAGDAVPAPAAPAWDVSAVPAAHLATVRAFLERRDGLPADARARLAAELDRALRPRVGGADERDPERFLEDVLAAKQARG